MAEMTLEQVRSNMRDAMNSVLKDDTRRMVVDWYNAIDAEIKAREAAQPVAWRVPTPHGVGYNFASKAVMNDIADWLAPAPAAQVTDEMVRRAMNAEFCGRVMKECLMMGTDYDEEVLRAALEAALAAQENPND